MGLLHSLTWFIMVAPVCCRLFRTDRSKLVEVFRIQIFRCSDYKVVAVLTDMDIEFIFKIQFCVVIFYSLQSQLVGSVMLCNLIVLQRTDLKMPLLLLKHNTFLHIVLLGGQVHDLIIASSLKNHWLFLCLQYILHYKQF